MRIFWVLSGLQTACVVGLLMPALAMAQSDTLSISGTFQMDAIYGDPGPDLGDVFVRGFDHTWTLTLHGVTFENDFVIYEYFDEFYGGDIYEEQYITRVNATSFTLEFFGPDAATLNSVVSDQLTDVAVVELTNGIYVDPDFPENLYLPFLLFAVELVPADPSNGVHFAMSTYNSTATFTPSYPTFEPQTLPNTFGSILDLRDGGYSRIESRNETIHIGSATPPPIIPSVSIFDGSVLEGDKGTRLLTLTLEMSSPSSVPLAVQYRTIDGTAKSAGSTKTPADYTAASGTVTFQPGQTTKTISIAVIGDRKREPNETFTVQISAPTTAVSIRDANATATILNDD